MNRLTLGIVLTFCLIAAVFADPVSQTSIQFTNFASVNPAFHAGVPVDLDGDGRFDVIERDTLRLFWNSGTNFLGGATYNYGRDMDFPVLPVVGDFDNDSDLDIFHVRVEQSFLRRSSVILWNRGNRVFTNLPSITFPALRFGSGAAGDFDNDGDLDIVLTGSTNVNNSEIGRNVMRLYENFGNGLFLESQQRFRGYEDGATAWADYDADGDLDLLVTGYTTNSIRGASVLYRNDSGQLVDSQISLPALFSDLYVPVSATWGDYDNDQDLDLLMAGGTLAGNIRRPLTAIMRNDGAAFTQVSFTTNQNANFFRATWCDFNADGHLDIIVNVAFNGSTSIYRNNGDGTFADPVNGTGAGDLRIAFWDDDAQPDLFSANFDFPVRASRNITAATNTPPAPPANLFAVQSNHSVTFSWNAAFDAEQSGGLTYNLRIGTTPGGSEIMSALANPATGRRYVAALGNTGLRTNWTIRNFSVGSYYWSVQAIDRSYVGSSFAPEQVFTISNAPPAVEMIATTNITSTSATLLFRLNPNAAATEYYVEFISGPGPSLVKRIDGETLAQLHLLVPGLVPSTPYEVRLAASNQFGISYSSARKFATGPAAVVSELPGPFPVLTQNPAFLPVDIDQDGDLDVIQSGVSNSFIRVGKVFLNNAGTFQEGPSLTLPTMTGLNVSAAADFDNDSLLDLIFATQSGSYLFLQKTNHPFSSRFMNERLRLDQIFPGDSDNDGDIDLLAAGTGPLGTAALYLNDNTDAFRPGSTRLDRAQIAEWGDHDNDGDNDLLLWGLTNEFQLNPAFAITRIYQNGGGNVFTNIHAALPGSWLGADWTDYDNDGDLDVFLITGTNTSSATTNDVRLFRNDGASDFTELTPIISDRSLMLLDLIDFNRDGRSDIFIYQDLLPEAKLRLFLNLGEDRFVEQKPGLPSLTSFRARFADFDGDHMPDILVQAQATNISQGRLRLFRNNLVSVNPLPPRPTNLSSTVARTSARLHWGLPRDNNEEGTNRIAWSFNLRVGKTPGGSEIMSSMADQQTGTLQIPSRGNAGQSGMWTIRDLPPGNYYWTVQSVDHAGNGSAFSEEATFNIAPDERPPQIIGFSRSTNGLHRLTIDGPARSRAEIHHSMDLFNWETNFTYVYIGGDPAVFSSQHGDTRFYRFQLLE